MARINIVSTGIEGFVLALMDDSCVAAKNMKLFCCQLALKSLCVCF